MDSALFLFINTGMQNAALDAVMPVITHKGYLIFIALTVPLFFQDWRKGSLVLALGFAGFFIADTGTDILKMLFGVPRPYDTLWNVRLLVTPPGSPTFPSAHASTSFAMASIIAYYSRRTAFPAFVVASLVAFSRIYVGVHYPSDVIGGAAFGVITGGGIILVERMIQKARNPK